MRTDALAAIATAILLTCHPVPTPALPATTDAPALLEQDWRNQDGIGTERHPSNYSSALESVFQRGDALILDLVSAGVDLHQATRQWGELRREWQALNAAKAGEGQCEDLWRRAHQLRRQIVFMNPLTRLGPLLFVKQAPGTFSHQLTQVYGRYARPGGGLFVLEQPGESLGCRPLLPDTLEAGSYQTPEVSYDGRRVLFAFCSTKPAAVEERFYRLYQVNADGHGLRQLTQGAYDDFSPRFLPDDRVVFVSTRRGGFHRCGSPGCPVYTLAVMDADGSSLRRISHHEVQEWDPAVLPDGRILYTRWDYVDRHAVFGQQLWTTRPDGTAPLAFYGNYTRNPVGVWEAQPVPGSSRVMATAAAHHAMTAGSIVLVDIAQGNDGLGPLTRLTPETPFPESEFPVSGKWFARAADAKSADTPENLRWPGHCYRTPWPLSEKYFIAAYSFAPLVGEPHGNPANMFGLYLVDCFGNKELLHRDPEISSLWPVPLRPRPRPPVLPTVLPREAGPEGTFIVQNVYESYPKLAPGAVKRLRVVQVLPKSTPGKDRPAVGLPAGAPGKAVLGTVPVEADGSACFVAPANVPLLFQALDESGQAVQIMRSATYLQPGETVSCVGCHEPRHSTPRLAAPLQALARPPSRLERGPDGSKPFSYPLLVQGLVDRHCVRCHNAGRADGGVNLTGDPQGHYTFSYNALAPLVSWSNDTNRDSLSMPGRYGARGSKLMQLLLEKGHYDVALNHEEIERLATWMDANALFYGTFDPADQARQQRGERIAGVKLE